MRHLKTPLLLFLILLTSCTTAKKDPKKEEMEKKLTKATEDVTSLEEQVKATIQDEGKQSWLRNDLELAKSRLARLKEQWKQQNGGKEFEEPKKEEAGGHH